MIKNKTYTEVLNDLYDYFLLADIDCVEEFKETNKIGDDILTPLITTEIGDQIVETGVLVPLAGIENHPYTVIFNYNGESAFAKNDSITIHNQSGYFITVKSSKLYLFTIPYLQKWAERLNYLVNNKPFFNINAGTYLVNIIVGYTMIDGDKEPTIEFNFSDPDDSFTYSADFMYQYTLEPA